MRATRLLQAPPDKIYRAFLDPVALCTWLPPPNMRAELHHFDPRPGGGYRMTLHYLHPDGRPRGKTTDDADTVEVRFTDLHENNLIRQAIDFESDDPTYGGTMTMTWTFTPVAGGTEVAVEVENEPPGIRPEDHELGMRASLDNLARFVE